MSDQNCPCPKCNAETAPSLEFTRTCSSCGRVSYNHNITLAQKQLIERIEAWSEQYTGCGWEEGVEYRIWGTRRPEWDREESDREAYRIRELAVACDSWVVCPKLSEGESVDPNLFGKCIPLSSFRFR